MIRNYSLDKITKIGREHKICQDYSDTFNSSSGLINNFIIVSDGCSSSEDTDIGSRIVSRLARMIITQLDTFNFLEISKDPYTLFGSLLMHSAVPVINSLGLKYECLDSTLIVSFIYNDIIHTFMYGDGTIIVIDKDNKIESTTIEFKNNAPYYLTARMSYSQTYKNHTKEPNMIIKHHSEDYMYPQQSDYPLYYQHHVDKYKAIILASDGLGSFKNYSSDDHPSIQEVITNLCNIKIYKGEFIQRRVNRMLSDYAKQNIYHYDDLSVVGISIHEE